MKKTLRAIALGIVSMSMPLIASAQTPTEGITKLGTLINDVKTQILDRLITFFATLALLVFFFGMVRFIFAARAGDAKKIEAGKNFMIWSVVALFVMFSIWGIVHYGQTIFGFTRTNITIPTITGGSQTPTTPTPGLPTSQGTACPPPNQHIRYMNQSQFEQYCNNNSVRASGTAGASCTTAAGAFGQVGSDGQCYASGRGATPTVGSACTTSSGSNGQIGSDGGCYVGGSR